MKISLITRPRWQRWYTKTAVRPSPHTLKWSPMAPWFTSRNCKPNATAWVGILAFSKSPSFQMTPAHRSTSSPSMVRSRCPSSKLSAKLSACPPDLATRNEPHRITRLWPSVLWARSPWAHVLVSYLSGTRSNTTMWCTPRCCTRKSWPLLLDSGKCDDCLQRS